MKENYWWRNVAVNIYNLELLSNDAQQNLLLLLGTINPYWNSLPSVYMASLQRLLLFNLRLFPCFCLHFVMQSIETEMEPLNFTIKMHKSKQNSYTLKWSWSFVLKVAKLLSDYMPSRTKGHFCILSPFKEAQITLKHVFGILVIDQLNAQILIL